MFAAASGGNVDVILWHYNWDKKRFEFEMEDRYSSDDGYAGRFGKPIPRWAQQVSEKIMDACRSDVSVITGIG